MASPADAIAGIESGGNYGILGPPTQSGDRAYGKYQVMGVNIPQWTQKWYGQSLTPDQFLQNPQAQDAVFNGQFGMYTQKYGPEGAARAWYGGPGAVNAPDRRDPINPNAPTVGQYGQRFMAGLGGAPPLISGPQQSYNPSSNIQVSGEGQSGQAGQQQSSYNATPYTPGPQGTIGNTGAPQANSQAELAGQGARGWNIYQTTPSWTGSPMSQSPPARGEGDFAAPAISGPQNPLQQRQAMLRQQLIARAFQNMPRGYQFKLG